MFNFSNYTTYSLIFPLISKYCVDSNKLVVDIMEYETSCTAIEGFFGLKPKIYSFLVVSNSEINKQRA